MTEFPIDQPDPAEITEQIENLARHSARLREAEAQEDHLEPGGIWHASGTQPCATGQPYPHNSTPECRMTDQPTTPEQNDCPSGRPYPHTYDRRCDGDPFDRTRHGTFRGKTHTATEDFGLPTVGALRHQIDQLTADRQALQAVITELQAELGEAQTEVAAMHRIAEGVDQIRASVVSRLDSIRNAAHNLIDALDEGDIDTIGRIERLREALYATTQVSLTDKGREILDSTPGESADGSVPDVAREVGKIGAHLQQNPDYGVHEAESPLMLPIDDRGETREPVTTERYMMATTAHHQLGDISRPEPNLALITGEDGDNWIGSWVEGYGYFNVRFPKATTRGLTDDEVQAYDGSLLDVGASRYVIRIPATGGIVKPGLGTSLIIGETGGCVIPSRIPRDVEDGDQ